MVSKQPTMLLVSLALLQLLQLCVLVSASPDLQNIYVFQAQNDDTSAYSSVSDTGLSEPQYSTAQRTWYMFSRHQHAGEPWEPVHGDNSGRIVASYIRGYSDAYPPVYKYRSYDFEKMLPPIGVLEGGFDREMKICRFRQDRRAYFLSLDGCDSDHFGYTADRVHSVYVSTERRDNEGTTHFKASVCKDASGFFYGTLSTGDTFCSGSDTNIRHWQLHAFYAGKACQEMAVDRDSDHMQVTYVRDYGVKHTEATFMCDQGYRMTPEHARLFCSLAGRWSATYPSCERVYCGEPPYVDNGRFDGADDFYFEAEVELTCDDGYEFDSEWSTTTLQCTAEGEWSQIHATCETKKCIYPRTLRNGQADFTDNTFGSVVDYSCNVGFKLRGSTTAECNANGQWSHDPPTCDQLKCSDLESPSHGRWLGETFNYDTTVAFSCDHGYVLDGASEIHCRPTGNGTVEWSDSPPTCQIHDCGSPPELENGNVQASSTTFESRARFSCNDGFRMQGSDYTQCTMEGWYTTVPVCQAITCRDPGVPTHSWRTVDGAGSDGSFGYNTVLQYFCETGYNIEGVNTLICFENGAWGPVNRAPACRMVECPALDPLPNGTRTGDFTSGVTMNFQCLPGFELHGNPSTHCGADGEWSNGLPECRACPMNFFKEGADGGRCEPCPENSETLVTASSSVEHCVCEMGTVRLEGQRSCDFIQCPKLSSPKNGSMGECSHRFGAQCEFDCNPGFVLRGYGSLSCGSSGQWTAHEPTCQACPSNTYKASAGSVACVPCPRNSHTNGRLGTNATDCVCRPGYTPSEFGACVDADECAVNKGNCSDTCDNTLGSYVCRCNIPGYELMDDGHTCYANRSCPELDSDPAHGYLDCRPNPAENGQICFIRCHSGYFFVSGRNDYLTCGYDTMFQWSHRRANQSAAIPGCTEEFYVDTQLPVTFQYSVPHPCDELDEYIQQRISDLVSETVDNLGTCSARCSLLNTVLACTDHDGADTSTLRMSFDILLRNMDNDSVDAGCNPTCKRQNMIGILGETLAVSNEVQTGVAGSTFDLPADWRLDIVVDSDSFHRDQPKLLCQEPGRVLTRYRLCVPCDKGHYLANRDDEFCTPCAKGYFQRKQGQTMCEPCYDDTTTIGTGATSSTMCSIDRVIGNVVRKRRSTGNVPHISTDPADIDIDEVLGILP